MVDRTTVPAIAAEPGVCWDTLNTTVMTAVAALVAAGPGRLAEVRMIGVDEHRWAPRRAGADGFVTVIIDWSPAHNRTGPMRLLDMVSGRSAAALSSWLAAQPKAFRDQVGIRRTARTRLQLLSTHQYDRLTGVLDTDDYITVKTAWLSAEAINGRLESLRRNALGFRNHDLLPLPLTAVQWRPTPTARHSELRKADKHRNSNQV